MLQYDVSVMVYLGILKVYKGASVKVYKGSPNVLFITNIKKKDDFIVEIKQRCFRRNYISKLLSGNMEHDFSTSKEI